MADTRSIVITLKLDKGSQEANPAKATNEESLIEDIDSDSSAKSAGKALAVQALKVVANEVIAWADYKWDKQLTLNDDYIGQRSKNIALTQINRATDIISSTISAAYIGASVLGPAGAAIGAAIGVISKVASIGRENAQAQEQQNIHIRQMNAQLDFTRSRTGWSTQAGSIGEDL